MMRRLITMIAAMFALSAPMAASAMEHGPGAGKHDHAAGNIAHEEVTEGVKATFKVMSMKEHLRSSGIKMPKGMKETHHVAVEFKDVRSGKPLTQGEVKVKLQGPDKGEQTRDMAGMQGHFGADFDLSKKGKYGIMFKFKLNDGKVRQVKFWYTAT